MSTERNELADEMCGWVVSSGYYGQSLGSEVAQEIAEHLIESGYGLMAEAWDEGARAAVGRHDTGYPIINPYRPTP